MRKLPTRRIRSKSCSRLGLEGTHVARRFSVGPRRQLEKIALLCMPTKPKQGHDFDPILQVLSLHVTRQKKCIFEMAAKPKRGHDFCKTMISACPKRTKTDAQFARRL